VVRSIEREGGKRRAPGDRRRAVSSASDALTITSGEYVEPLCPPLALNNLADPDLTRLCSVWQALPDHIRAAILSLVATAR
jgi:hypothetical protein